MASRALSLLGRALPYMSLLVGAFYVFSRVRSDYRARGKLSRPTTILQFGYFGAYALSSYPFLDARFSQVRTDSLLFLIALVLMAAGLQYCARTPRYLGLPKRKGGG